MKPLIDLVAHAHTHSLSLIGGNGHGFFVLACRSHQNDTLYLLILIKDGPVKRAFYLIFHTSFEKRHTPFPNGMKARLFRFHHHNRNHHQRHHYGFLSLALVVISISIATRHCCWRCNSSTSSRSISHGFNANVIWCCCSSEMFSLPLYLCVTRFILQAFCTSHFFSNPCSCVVCLRWYFSLVQFMCFQTLDDSIEQRTYTE